jgi:ribonuclease G
MASEILYSWGPGESRLALVKDGRLVEISLVRPELLAGAVVMGRVVELAPKQGAAFVDIGQERPAFLQGVKGMTNGLAVLAQVKADAHGGKGATLTTEISLPGRYVALQPARSGLLVSRKLSDDKRQRLLDRLAPLVFEHEGVVARTHAIHAGEAELSAELDSLRATWAAILAGKSGRAPVVLWRPDPLERLLAEHPGVSRVLVDDDAAFAAARSRFGELVERYRHGPLFDLHEVEDSLSAALSPVVNLACGGRVAIEPTAALTAIDVDSGPANPIEANMQAVPVIARQLRLRNIAGQIVIDFVSGGGKGALLKLVSLLKQAVAGDPNATHVIGMTPLGLIELTRERRGPSLADLMQDRATIASADAVALRALRQGLAEAAHRPGRALTLVVAPDIAGALARRPEALAEIEARLGRKLAVRADGTRGRDDVGIEDS